MKCYQEQLVTIKEGTTSTRLLLIHAPYPGRLKFDSQPSSLLFASSQVVQALHADGRGDEVGYLDPRGATEEFYEQLGSIAAAGELRVVCISTSTAAIEQAARIAQLVRDVAPNQVLIIGGGPHEDDCPIAMATAIPAVDISIAGDAEHALLPIVLAALDGGMNVVGDVNVNTLRGRGVITGKEGQVRTWSGPKVGVTEWALQRPWVDREILFPIFPGRATLPLTVSHGCSYGQCTFCAESLVGGQTIVKDFSLLKSMIEAAPGAALYFQDSIFPATREAREELLPILRESGRPWGCQVYLPTLSRTFIRLLADSGCTYVYTGVESGSEELRSALGKPGLNSSLIRQRLLWVAETGMRVGLSLMFGGMSDRGELLETEHSVMATIMFTQQVLNDGVDVAGFYPNVLTVLPGTALSVGLQSTCNVIDFYRAPRVPQFAELEDGEIGYNFASIPWMRGGSSQLVDSVKDAAKHVASCK